MGRASTTAISTTRAPIRVCPRSPSRRHRFKKVSVPSRRRTSVRALGLGRLQMARNRPRNIAVRAETVVHSGGHKPSPTFSRIPCFTVFLENPRSSVWNPSLSASKSEFCYLQLRMLCELIAVGCLVVHGDVEGTKGLCKVWAADKVMKRLEKLHPDFYPHPMVFTFPKPGPVL